MYPYIYTYIYGYIYIGIIKGSVGEMWKLSSPAQTFMLQEPVFISANGR